MNYKSFNLIVERSKINPEGTVRCLQFIFRESRQKAEYDSYVIKQKRIANIIVRNNIILVGELNNDAIEKFLLVNGTESSERIRL